MRIGGITINIESELGDICPPKDSSYRAFSVRDKGAESGADHMNVVLEQGNYPEQAGMARIFDSGSSWSMLFDGVNRFVSMQPFEFKIIKFSAPDHAREHLNIIWDFSFG